MIDADAKPIVLVDGSSYLYRAFYASQQADLRTDDGFPTGAIRVVVSMLRSLIKQFPYSVIAVIFDAKGKTFRDDIYPEYKANRPSMPDELRDQIQPIHEVITAMGLPMLVVDGVEADDVIGTLAAQATNKKIDVVISTGDKDMAQLVSDHVLLMDTMKNVFTDRERVKDKFGVPPERIVDYLALVGDTVDNIPGVPKCGPKTAAKWLTEYQSLENLMANADSIKGKVGENLRDSLDFLPLSYELATIKLNVKLDISIDELAHTSEDNNKLRELFTRFQFKTWMAELGPRTQSNDTHCEQQRQQDYHIVLNQADLNYWIEQLNAADVFSFDTETTSLNYMEAKIVGVSFAIEKGVAAYVPFAHDYVDAPEQLSEDKVLSALKPILEDATQAKIGQNLKYDQNVLANHGIELKGIAFDTMLESYVLDATASRHDMDTLAKKYLDINTIHFEDIAGKGAKQLTFNQVILEKAGAYAAEDADITLQLHNTLWPKLKTDASLASVFNNIELPLVQVLSRMERNGALVSSELLSEQSAELGQRLNDLEKEAFDLAGEEFNLSSPKQLGHILFEKLKLPVIKKTPKGAASTAEQVLAELALDYPLPKVLMEFRGLSKLKSTYTDKLPEMISSESGRIHTSYHQAVTATGRLSSSDPNLQNIPIRTPQGRRVRQAFIAKPGYKILAADYSQIELRIMAHLSQDKGLLMAFAQDKDIHRATAAEVFAAPLEQVTDEQRRNAKAINFGLIYGMSAFGLGKQLQIGRNQAQEYIDTYFTRYPGVKNYMDRTREQATEQGYVQTLFGRRLYLPQINASNGMHRQAAQRTAINAPMQGTAADIIKRAMISVDKWLSESSVNALMVMQVHDELVFEVEQSSIDQCRDAISSCMSNAAELDVPLVVDIGVGDNWDQAH